MQKFCILKSKMQGIKIQVLPPKPKWPRKFNIHKPLFFYADHIILKCLKLLKDFVDSQHLQKVDGHVSQSPFKYSLN